MKEIIPLVVALFSSVLILPAYAYQFEIEADYSDSETDFDGSSSPDIDADSISISGTYYFNNVETNKGPLNVASFLSRTSNISAFYSDGETEIDATQVTFTGPAPIGGIYGYGAPILGFTYSIPKYEIDTEEYVVSGQYIHAKSGWLIGALYGYLEEDSDLGIDLEQDSYGIGIGKYIAQYTRLMLDYIHTETDVDTSSGNASSDSDAVNIGLFHVQELGRGTYYDASIDIAYLDSDDGDDAHAYSASTTYYFSPHVGVGINLSHIDGDNIDSTSYGVSGEWFITDNFAVNVNYVRSNIDDSDGGFILAPYRGSSFTSNTTPTADTSLDADIDSFSIGAKLRF
jgi:hypothetical protein